MSRSTAPLPAGYELTPLDDDYRRDPDAVYARLREREPVHFDPLRQAWIVTEHRAVLELLRDRTLAVDRRRFGLPADPRPESPLPERAPGLLGLDDPDHKRLRGLVSKAFTPQSVRRLAPRIETIVDEVLGAISDPEDFDLIREFASPIPTRVIAELLGVDAEDFATFRGWTETLLKQLYIQPTPEQWSEIVEADTALHAYFVRVVAERRAQPRDDLISKLIRARDEADALSEDEIITNSVLLLGAGNLTTTDLIGNGVLNLLRNPDQLAKLRERADRIDNAVEEMLRFDGPTIQVTRFATRDLVVSGTRVPEGAQLHLILRAANRDPEAYPEPNRFDIERADTSHLSFGLGNHLCLGAPLARLEARIAIPRLLDAFPHLRLAPDRPVVWRRIINFRGCSRLRVQGTASSDD